MSVKDFHMTNLYDASIRHNFFNAFEKWTFIIMKNEHFYIMKNEKFWILKNEQFWVLKKNVQFWIFLSANNYGFVFRVPKQNVDDPTRGKSASDKSI